MAFPLLIEAIKQTTLACPWLFWRLHKVAHGTCERPVTLSKPGSYLAGKKTETTCWGQSGALPRLLPPAARFPAVLRLQSQPSPLSTESKRFTKSESFLGPIPRSVVLQFPAHTFTSSPAISSHLLFDAQTRKKTKKILIFLSCPTRPRIKCDSRHREGKSSWVGSSCDRQCFFRL